MTKKYSIIILSLVFILTAGITLTVLAENEPVDNSVENARSEIGPGEYCDNCEDGPQQLQRRMEEQRQLAQGEKGEQRKLQQRNQRMQFGR